MTQEQYEKASIIMANIKTAERNILRWSKIQSKNDLRILDNDSNNLPLFVPINTIVRMNIDAAKQELASLEKELESL